MMNRRSELTAVPVFVLGLAYFFVFYDITDIGRLRVRGFALADGGGHLGGAVGALLLPTLISDTTFFLGFAVIGITGLLAGLIALGGPKTSGRSLEKVTR
jgi:hypothetical protein